MELDTHHILLCVSVWPDFFWRKIQFIDFAITNCWLCFCHHICQTIYLQLEAPQECREKLERNNWYFNLSKMRLERRIVN